LAAAARHPASSSPGIRPGPAGTEASPSTQGTGRMPRRAMRET
jgi:hypothetical protein